MGEAVRCAWAGSYKNQTPNTKHHNTTTQLGCHRGNPTHRELVDKVGPGCVLDAMGRPDHLVHVVWEINHFPVIAAAPNHILKVIIR